MNIVNDLNEIIKDVANILLEAPGVEGVVLGGSRARGTEGINSDIDMGIYYSEAAGFNARDIGIIAAHIDDEHREGLITSLGAWGPWINGGGWLEVEGYLFDFVFRDVEKVSQVIDDCLRGKVEAHYHAGHPHAFVNVMYMGEIATGKILADPKNRIAELKAKTNTYPKAMQQAIIKYFMFEANYSLMYAADNVEKDDVTYVAGCCYRTIACLNQVIFAMNEEYCLNEKKAAAKINDFNIKPSNYQPKVDYAITLISADMDKTSMAIEILKELIAETEKLLQN
ncbi:Nucleotidyltransferase domain protein [Sporotomaculum syntrophicum]|uniref:Nucleotidyltransferase domain protein n=1 Tax=Sporotomaculum syntrophicum TaxID=182264 RepID=A0A9D3AWH1_9FIRM|nr:nucleotidyltransferase domain-containing protein [Sporotomaculum syntrophicum]KAF1085420.1 Nucleotidyltransferase domain protein [Sporotomaculum syntrophicum]